MTDKKSYLLKWIKLEAFMCLVYVRSPGIRFGYYYFVINSDCYFAFAAENPLRKFKTADDAKQYIENVAESSECIILDEREVNLL